MADGAAGGHRHDDRRGARAVAGHPGGMEAGSAFDKTSTTGIALTFWSMPTFWLGMMRVRGGTGRAVPVRGHDLPGHAAGLPLPGAGHAAPHGAAVLTLVAVSTRSTCW